MLEEKLREIIIQYLYMFEVQGIKDFELLRPIVMRVCAVSKKKILIAEERAHEVFKEIAEIDAAISRTSENYADDRISVIDRSILRLMLFELFFKEKKIQHVIEEGVRLSKKFSSPEACRFVHAIIDGVYKGDHLEVAKN